MTVEHARQMEFQGYSAATGSAMSVGLDVILRRDVPEPIHARERAERLTPSAFFMDVLKSGVLERPTKPIAITLGHEATTLFARGDNSCDLEIGNPEQFDDLLAEVRNNDLSLLVVAQKGGSAAQVEPLLPLVANDNWVLPNRMNSAVSTTEQLDQVRQQLGHAGWTPAEIWKNVAAKDAGGYRRVLIFPPETRH